MRLFDMPITDIDQSKLNELIDDEVVEDKWLDYKERPLDRNKDEKRDFLTDIAAFANSAGGDILLGIRERRDSDGRCMGIPEEVVGIKIDNWDAFRLSWANQILNGIEPQIQGIEIEPIPIDTDRIVVIFRIPPSLQAPHMVTSRPSFYTRGGATSYPMDIDAIRFAFLKSASLREQAEAFHQRQVANISAGSGRVVMEEGPRVFLHIVPLGSQPFSVNVGAANVQSKLRKLPTLLQTDVVLRLCQEITCSFGCMLIVR